MPSSKDVLVRRDTTVRYATGTTVPVERAEAMRKYLASFSTGRTVHSLWESSGVQRRNVSYELLEVIMKKSATVAAVVRRNVEDVMSPGYTFIPTPGVKNPKPKQREIAIKRFSSPSVDDIANDWLEGIVYDLAVFSDMYMELAGATDKIVGKVGDVPIWDFGGPLQDWYHVDASTMWLKYSEHGQTNDPPRESYLHTVKHKVDFERSGRVQGLTNRGKAVYFTRGKITHAGKFKDGDYGTPALLPLITVLAAQFNLTDYVGKLYAGEVPKALMNVGDMDPGEIKALIHLIKQQIDTATNPFGIVAVNVPDDFSLERLMDTAREGRFIELLEYYREEICAVFGIHPSKLGWGELRGDETMAMDTWYDVVESFHRKIEAIINNAIMPLLGVTDWRFKFNSPRPKKEEHEARNRAMHSQAVMLLRKSHVITINEARTQLLGLEKLPDAFADDATYVPPQASGGPGGTPGVPGTPPTEPPKPGQSPEGPKPPQRPPMEPGGGTSQRPPKPPKKEAVITFEKGRPPNYVIERIPDKVGDKQVIRLTPYEDFIKENEIYAMGVEDADDNDEGGDN